MPTSPIVAIIVRQLPIVLLALCLPATAGAYTFATDTGDDTGTPLHWDLGDDGPIELHQHHLGGGGLPSFLLHGAARNAMQSWVEVRSADFSFQELGVFLGVPCPHAILGDDLLIEQVCGGPMPDHDFTNALFFIETVWPFGEEVIALTTLSWTEGGVLVDADIAYNGLDYGWSVFEDEILVDYESITLHELGHFLGLGHSPELGAIMRIDYQEGTLARVLGTDDGDGVGALYPCASGTCIGSVFHDAPDKCDTADAGRAGLWGLLLVLGAVAWRRRSSQATGVAALLGAGLLLVPLPATTSTVAALGIDDLTDRADRVVRVRVTQVTPYQDRVVRTRIELEVQEEWKGAGDLTIVLDQPGGVLGARGTLVFGMPRFAEGDDVVLFLSEDALIGTRVLGLAQGAFEVVAGGAVERDLSGLMLARVGGRRAPRILEAPRTLEALRLRVRR
jgi:MYXO-CTERM domain-containing protein